MLFLTHRRRLLGYACLCLSIIFFGFHPVFATSKIEAKRFDVREGKASKTLRQAALQAEVQFIYSASVVRGVRTHPISGELKPIEAFDLMLTDTSLAVFKHPTCDVYTVRKVADETSSNPNNKYYQNTPMNKKRNKYGIGLKVMLTAGFSLLQSTNAQDDEAVKGVFELSPFEVKADTGASLYSINQSSTGTRIATTVRELPFSLDVLTMDYLDDFHMADPSMAIAELSNIGVGTPQNGAGAGNTTRGFSQYYALRDGFYRNGVVDKTLIDRVEVLKGPYAAIYGRGEPGGLINFVPKTPVYGENSGEVGLQFGQNNTYRIQTERNIAIGEKTALLVAASYYERDFDLEYSYERSRNIGAILKHKLTENDEITLDFEHMMRRNNRGHGIFNLRAAANGTYNGEELRSGNYIGLLGRDLVEEYGYLNGRGPYQFNERYIEQYGIKWTHKFSDALNLRVKYGNQNQDQPYNYAGSGNNVIRVDEDLNFVRWDSTNSPRWSEINEGGRALNVDLTAKWTIGESKHTTLLTFDDSFTDKDRFEKRPALSSAESSALSAERSNIYRNYIEYNPWSYEGGYSNLRRDELNRVSVTGVFLMHQAKLFDDKLLVLMGTRYDKAKTETANRITETSAVNNADDQTYNIGVNYNITPHTMVYASHATSFDPKGGFYTNAGQAPLPNESGKGSELGIRTSLFDNKVDVGFTYYEIEKFNIKTDNPEFDPDAINPATGYKNIPDLGDLDSNGVPFTADQIQAFNLAYRDLVSTVVPGGVATSAGYEIYANGRVTDNLSIRASWGTADTEWVKTDALYVLGKDFRRTPSWTYSLSANYRLTEGRLKGMNFGLGYSGQDSFRMEDRNDNRINLYTDNYLNLKLSASYRWKGEDLSHKVAVSMNNATDRISVTKGAYLTEGRNIQASYTLNY